MFESIVQNIDTLNYKFIEMEKKMENKNSLIQILMRDNVEMKKRIKTLEDLTLTI